MEPVLKLPEGDQVQSPEFEVVNDKDKRDPDYYYLDTPIEVDGREIKVLRINHKGVLKGREWFALLAAHRRKFPEETNNGNPLYRYLEEGYLSMLIAKLNNITAEDVYKVDSGDLPLLFQNARLFQFSGASKQTE
jgi:hypothetical protein